MRKFLSPNFLNYSVPCEQCSIGPLCMPSAQYQHSCKFSKYKITIAKNQLLVKAGQPFSKLYAVHSGCLKSYSVTKEGKEQILGFYLPGDIVGFEAMTYHKYINSVKALSNTTICEFNYHDFIAFIESNNEARSITLRLMSTEILNYQKLLLMLSQKNAEKRLASFIYSIYYRYALRGFTSTNIKLAMSRHDIANHLGLTIETISRILKRLQQLDILHVKGKHIFIKNLAELIKFSGELE
jgi:CRP/FNR family transcriptional regulator, anaerobic regulatory protein